MQTAPGLYADAQLSPQISVQRFAPEQYSESRQPTGDVMKPPQPLASVPHRPPALFFQLAHAIVPSVTHAASGTHAGPEPAEPPVEGAPPDGRQRFPVSEISHVTPPAPAAPP